MFKQIALAALVATSTLTLAATAHAEHREHRGYESHERYEHRESYGARVLGAAIGTFVADALVPPTYYAPPVYGYPAMPAPCADIWDGYQYRRSCNGTMPYQQTYAIPPGMTYEYVIVPNGQGGWGPERRLVVDCNRPANNLVEAIQGVCHK